MTNGSRSGLRQMRYADNSERVAIRSQDRGNDRDPLPGLGQRKQGVRRAALSRMLGSTRARRQAALNILRSE